MAFGSADRRLELSERRGEGLTPKQLELMAKGSLLDRFKKLQRDVGNPSKGAMFKGRFCIYLGEFLSNPPKLAHEKEYEEWCREKDPLEEMFKSLKRHFGEHKGVRAQEWVDFRREPGEELSALLFRLQSVARDLGKDKDDQALVVNEVCHQP
jgi:hypothetical protein